MSTLTIYNKKGRKKWMAKSIKSSKELQSLPAYELIQEQQIKELNSLGLVFRHKKSGARVAVISNDDDNKVFSIGFRTPPEDSTGVAHIVEHTVLCGSDKYPSKDPFVELAKGSLNTFLNAMTFSDKTIYPVASCNEKDFQNLMDVYMDAVFHPNIYKNKSIFQQEGWYYELEKEEDDLKINGVVYNEMKGVFSSPEQQLYRSIQCSLFPDTTYGMESGGDPKDIPNLTYEAYLDFHKKYYHPTNSYIYLYGDMDIEEKLNWMDEEYLGHYDYAPVDSEIKKQAAFSEMKTVREKYSISESDAEKAGNYFSYNVVLETSLDKELYLAFQILQMALIKFPGAPVKRALIEAGIGIDVLSEYENGIYQPYFSIIAKEAEAGREEEFLSIIRDTLKKVCEEGIGEDSLRAAINYHEFRFKEGDFGSYPKGLMYGIDVLDSWLYDDSSVFTHLQAEETFKKMKENVTTGYFETLIETYLIDNPHSTFVVVEPEVGLTAKEEQALKEKLQAYKASLSKEEIQEIIAETKALREWQETPSTQEELEMIPLLEREDIRREINPILNEKYNIANVTALHHNINTNGIGYIKLGFALENYLGYAKYLSLLSYVLGKVGTEHYEYQELANQVNIYTGGIVYDIETYDMPYKKDDVKAYFEINAKVLYENMEKAFGFITDTIFTSCLEDKKRFKELVSEARSKMRIKMNSSAHSLAAGRALAHVSKGGRLTDALVGWEYYLFLSDLEEHFDEKFEEVSEMLKKACASIFRKENMILSVTCQEDGLETFKTCAEQFIGQVEAHKSEFMLEANPEIPCMNPENEGIKTAGQVQFAALAGNYMEEGQNYTGTLKVLKTIMAYDYLWVNIRVKGGAYGCMCNFFRNGNAYFVSYRDPNLLETIEVYKNVADYVADFDVDARDMTKFVLGTMSMADTPLNPSAKGDRSYNCYMTGLTEEQLQKERDSIIDCQAEDIRALAGHMKAVLDNYVLCVVGNEDKIEEQKNLFDKTFNL